MPKYTNSKITKGSNFVEIDGVSYRKTGNYKLLTSVPVVPDASVKLLYVDSCSAAAFGEQQLSDGGFVTIPASQSEFQVKFDGTAGDSATLQLQDASSGPCNVTLTVNPAGNLLWEDGAGFSFEFTSVGQVLNYTDCNGNTYDVSYAGTGSWIIRVYSTSKSTTPPASTGPNHYEGRVTANNNNAWEYSSTSIPGTAGLTASVYLTAGDTASWMINADIDGTDMSFLIVSAGSCGVDATSANHIAFEQP